MSNRAITLFGLAMLAPAAQAQTVFTDTEFFLEDWDHTILMSEGDVVLGPFSQEPDGGNPGNFQLGYHQTDGPFAAIYDGHLYLDSVYIPSVDGAIGSVDIQYDWIDLDPGGVQHGLAVFQGGEAFIRFVDSAGPYEQWKTLSLEGITEDDPQWQRVTNSGIFNDGPDFSASGEDLAFGYYSFNWSLPQGFLIQRTWGVDNFIVTLHAACEADCDGDATLSVLDFVCFQQAFVAQTPDADCNKDGQYNILDFVCFQALFLAGCS